ncbi:hypothetical protein BDA96_03G161500 [Sorghum bicolor]|uniref:Uncharacterized protein n=1 Tax=Sorghum bicolor TaxID=4558 RepID=A0A921RD40_SORBI|nr:hypothetical protein BDA96_03G161500 [Sorghum bicolor]
MDRLAYILNRTLAKILTLGGKLLGMHKKAVTLGYHFCVVCPCSWFFGGKC